MNTATEKEVMETLKEVINAYQFFHRPIVDPLMSSVPRPRLKRWRFALKRGKCELKIEVTPEGVLDWSITKPSYANVYFVDPNENLTHYKLRVAVENFAGVAACFPPREVVALLKFLDALARYLRRRGEGRIRALEELRRQQKRFVDEIEARSALRSLG